MPLKPEQLSYDLRIGVTGHRNLSQEKAVSEAVDRLVAYIDKMISHNENLPIEWVVISPLAKGADRIVARSILKKENAHLKVIMPFPIDEYRNDFTDPKDLQEFDALLERADPPMKESKKKASDSTTPPRTEGYLRVGRKVVDACEILIAIWDSKTAKGKGGTAEIVKYALERKRTILWIDAENPYNEAKLLLPLNEGKQENSLSKYEEHPLPENIKKLSLNYFQFAKFSTDNTLCKTKQTALIDKCCNEIRTLAKETKLPNSQLEPILKYLIPTYIRANELSLHYQKRHVLVSKAIHFFAAIAVSFVVFQVIFFPSHEHLWIITMEICAMIGVLVALIISRRFSWHEKWIDYRFLAEQLRTATYTIVLNENPLSGSAPLPFYNKPKYWIDFTIANQIKKVLKDIGPAADFNAVKNFIIKGWINDQKIWHKNKAKKKEQVEQLMRITVFALFFVTLAMAIIHRNGIGHDTELGKWSTFLAITLPACGAALHAIGKQLEYDRIAERSSKMADELSRLVTLAHESETLEELRDIIDQAIQTVNLETFEWWALISFDSPELVA